MLFFFSTVIAQELPTDPNTWAKTGGILGLIILALLTGGAFLVRWLVGFISEMRTDSKEQTAEFREHLDKQAIKHREERAEWQTAYSQLYQQHREERQEWREATRVSNDSLRRSIESQNHELAKEIENGLEKGLEKIFARIDKRKDH